MLLKKPKRFHWPVFTRLGALATRWPVLVIALWLIVPAALLFATPSLSDAVRDHPVELVPASAPAMVTEQQMAEAFHESGGENLMLIVLTNDGGLTPADENVYRTLITALKADGKDVKMLQDFINTPAMREIVTSEDGKAWIIPVGLTGGLDTPEGGDAYKRVSEIVHRITDGTSLKVGITGPSATIADLTEVGDADMHLIEIATLVLVLGILAMVYRRPVTMMLPLVTIGLTLLTARGVVAGLSEIGLGVSNEVVILMTAMVAGAGTDYAVFLISRYHEELREGRRLRHRRRHGDGRRRQGDRGIGCHGGDHVPVHELRQAGPAVHRRTRAGDHRGHRDGRCVHLVARRADARGPSRLGQPTPRADHEDVAQLRREAGAPPGQVPHREPGRAGHPRNRWPIRPVRLGREQELARQRAQQPGLHDAGRALPAELDHPAVHRHHLTE